MSFLQKRCKKKMRFGFWSWLQCDNAPVTFSPTSQRQKRNFVSIEVGFPPPLSSLSFLFFLFSVLLCAFSTPSAFPFFFSSSSSSIVFVWACWQPLSYIPLCIFSSNLYLVCFFHFTIEFFSLPFSCMMSVKMIAASINGTVSNLKEALSSWSTLDHKNLIKVSHLYFLVNKLVYTYMKSHTRISSFFWV